MIVPFCIYTVTPAGRQPSWDCSNFCSNLQGILRRLHRQDIMIDCQVHRNLPSHCGAVTRTAAIPVNLSERSTSPGAAGLGAASKGQRTPSLMPGPGRRRRVQPVNDEAEPPVGFPGAQASTGPGGASGSLAGRCGVPESPGGAVDRSLSRTGATSQGLGCVLTAKALAHC